MNPVIQWFCTSVLPGVLTRNANMRADCGMPPASWGRQLISLPSVTALIADYQPSPELKVVEFLGEVLFPYHFDEVYARLTDKDREALDRLGLYVDPLGRPEAIMRLNAGGPEAHFAELDAVRQPLKTLRTRTKVLRNAWHWDADVELQNIKYHVQREGGNPEAAFDYLTRDFYDALQQVCENMPERFWRDDFYIDDQYVGHSMWAANRDEAYWVSPVTARTPFAQKLRVGNLMFLHGMQYAYDHGFAAINMGVDEYDYKAQFWKTSRIFKPGLRRFA